MHNLPYNRAVPNVPDKAVVPLRTSEGHNFPRVNTSDRRHSCPRRRDVPAYLHARSGRVGGGGLVGRGFGAVPATAAVARPTRKGAQLVLLGIRAGPPVVLSQAGLSIALVVNGATYIVDCWRPSLTQHSKVNLCVDALKAMFIAHLHADHVSDCCHYFVHGGNIKNNFGDHLAGPVESVWP